jgi:hypothetical protein
MSGMATFAKAATGRVLPEAEAATADLCAGQVRGPQQIPRARHHSRLQGDILSSLFCLAVTLVCVQGKKEKDIMIVPKESFATLKDAEEQAALLALFHFTPTLPLEKKFPEPFDAVWLSLGSAKPEIRATRLSWLL